MKYKHPTGGTTEFEYENNTTVTAQKVSTSQNYGNLTIGYSSTTTYPHEVSQTGIYLTAGTYQLSLNSSAGGGPDIEYATLTLNTASGNYVNSVSAEISNSISVATKNISITTSGNYTLVLRKQCNATGIGAQGWLSTQTYTVVNTNTPVGGLRVKSISFYDAINTALARKINYSYNDDNGLSTGVLFSIPTYVQALRNDMVRDIGLWNPTTGFQPSPSNSYGFLAVWGSQQPFYQSPNSIRPMAVSLGSHIGYARVKVSETGNGYSVYTYNASYPTTNGGNTIVYPDDISVKTINPLSPDPNTPNFPAEPLREDPNRGELLSETQYNEAGQKVKQTLYTNTYTVSSNISTPCFMVSSISGAYLGTKYWLGTYRKTQQTAKERLYAPGGTQYSESETVTKYESSYHNSATSTSVTNSTGEELKTINRYAFDYVPPACAAMSDCSAAYLADSANAYATYMTALSNCGTSACRTSAYLTYVSNLRTARTDYIGCRGYYFNDASNLYKSAHDAAKANADAEYKPVLWMQDIYMNTPIEVTQWRNGKTTGATYTKFSNLRDDNKGLYPYKTLGIDLAVPVSDFTASSVNTAGTSITRDSRYTDFSDLDFNAGNLISITGRNGVPLSYLWGYNNTLPIAKVSNAANNYKEINQSGSIVMSGTREFFYEGFEESTASGVISGTAHTGSKYFNTVTYSVSWSKPNTRTYYIQWWNLTGGTWVMNQETYTGSKTLTGPVDDIRIFPSDAQMSTYTYNPLLGMTSETDANGRTLYYDYDVLGRLTMIRDKDGKLLKKYDYTFQSTVTPSGTCTTGTYSGDRKCVNGYWEKGKRVNTSTILITNTGSIHFKEWKCIYHYEWSDGSSSANSVEYSDTPCDVSQ